MQRHPNGYSLQSFRLLTMSHLVLNLLFSIDIISSVEENDLLGRIELYPNPTDGILTIVHPDGAIIERLELFDINGRSVLIRETKDSSLELDLRNISNGIYELKIDALDTSITKKIVKK